MSKPHYNPVFRIKSLLLSLTVFFALTQCTEDLTVIEPENSKSVTSERNVSPATCSTCTYVVPSNAYLIDGIVLGLKPGSVICLNAANTYKTLLFRNIKGTAESPIIITNCGGTATINAAGYPVGIKTETSQHFKISGGTGSTYGIHIASGHISLSLDKLSTNFEIDHLEISNSGFAGVMAKTDPTCDYQTVRWNFIMRNVLFHHNYVHDTAGEAFYIGHSFFSGVSLTCGIRLPHTIEGLRIYDNKIINAGWEAIQVGCAMTGAFIYNNIIENFGTKNVMYQNNGIQLNEGTKGILYNNYIKNGPGTGINNIGNGDVLMHNNIIEDAGSFGIFCDERTSRGAGMRIINNTIINPKQDGIRLYTEFVPNIVQNNIIVNPGGFSAYTYPRTGTDAYVHLLVKTMPAQITNNYFTTDINSVQFVDPSTFNYRLTGTSPAVNKGTYVSGYNAPVDYYQQPRLKGPAYDLGASEY